MKKLEIRVKFIAEAVWSVLRRSRIGRIAAIVATLWPVFHIAGLFLTIPFPALGWRTWLLISLGALIVALLLVIEAIYRFYLRSDFELKNNHSKEIAGCRSDCYVMEGLSVIHGALTSIEQSTFDDSLTHRLQIWQGGLEGTIVSRLGAPALIEFRQGSRFPDQIPETLSEQRDWIIQQKTRLTKLMQAVRQEGNVSLAEGRVAR